MGRSESFQTFDPATVPWHTDGTSTMKIQERWRQMTAARITEVVDFIVPDLSPLFAPVAPGLIRNAKVEGSTPFTGTNEIKHLAQPARLGFVASGPPVGNL
jgi:hypothetical protein